MPRKVWVYTPGIGGTKIPPLVREETERRLRTFAEKHYKGKFTRLDIRFNGHFCYVDAYDEPEVPRRLPKDWHETREEMRERLRNTPVHLLRLRYRRNDKWGLAFFNYCQVKYETNVYTSGEYEGTPEEAFELAAGFHLE